MIFRELDKFIDVFTKLPGIGEKSARRIAFYLLKKDIREVEELANSIIELRNHIQFCKKCGGYSKLEICEICGDPAREPSLICVVEDPSDIFLIESTNEFKGLYHVLMGALSPIDGIGPDDLRIQELEKRLKEENIVECFIATNPTLEGDATADYIVKRFSKFSVKFTRLVHGIPTGSLLEFIDRYTLIQSIKIRRV